MNALSSLPRQLTLVLTLHAIGASASTIIVPGTADPWLAGMPDGSKASTSDVAPAQSPVLAADVPIVPGTFLAFTVSGGVAYANWRPISTPDGSTVTGHQAGAQNGVSDVLAPADALMGVFLGPNPPTSSAAPPKLDFSSAATRDYATLSPALQQVFFIGDGMTSLGAHQQIQVPTGATRLFFGAMDGSEWGNNIGSFTVVVTPFPALSIRRLDEARVQIAWPTNAAGYLLEWTPDLAAPNWTADTNLPEIEGEDFTVIESSQAEARLYRLRK